MIKHFYFKSLTPKEIKARLDEVHATSASVLATVYNWVNEFKDVCTSTKDEHRSAQPETTPEKIDKIQGIILCNRLTKVREIAEAKGMSQDTVFLALHEKLVCEKIFSKIGSAFAPSRE